MMILLLIPLLFSLHQISVRKGLKRTDVLTGNFISIATTTALFLPILILRFHKDLKFVALMVLAGFLNFVLARLCFYASIKRVGANVASALSATRIYIAELFGAMLGENVTLKLLFSSTLIFAGIVSISNPKRKGDLLGVALGVLTAIFVVLSSLVVKIGLKICDDPITGSSISYLSAFILFSFVFTLKKESSEFSPYFVFAGLLVGFGHLLRYYALSIYPLSLVEPIISIYPVFTIFLSYLLIRDMEPFDARTIIGCLLVIAGVYGCFI